MMAASQTKDGIIGTVVLFGLIVAFVKFCLPEERTPAQRAADTCSDQTLAFYTSQTFVKRQLKAPATAEFPWSNEDGVSIREVKNCEFSVRAFVDSENGFGAKLRTNYSVDVRYDPAEETWYASNLSIQ